MSNSVHDPIDPRLVNPGALGTKAFSFQESTRDECEPILQSGRVPFDPTTIGHERRHYLIIARTPVVFEVERAVVRGGGRVDLPKLNQRRLFMRAFYRVRIQSGSPQRSTDPVGIRGPTEVGCSSEARQLPYLNHVADRWGLIAINHGHGDIRDLSEFSNALVLLMRVLIAVVVSEINRNSGARQCLYECKELGTRLGISDHYFRNRWSLGKRSPIHNVLWTPHTCLNDRLPLLFVWHHPLKGHHRHPVH
jgi:hypothetical protein